MTFGEILNKLRGLNVLVIGDLMLDHYIWGDVQRISPEAPVPVVHATHETHTAGGAANVAYNLASLGIPVSLAGALGDDLFGKSLLTLLGNAEIDTSLCEASASRPSIVKTRVIARNQQLCRIDHEAASSSYQFEISSALEEAVKNSDAIIVSDYAKGVISQELLHFLIDQAQALGKIIAVDPKPSRELQFLGASLITPNRHEALELAGLPEPEYGAAYPLNEVCSRIFERYAPELLVVTLGAEGMALSSEGKVDHLLPTFAREVFDVSGAGDTVIATLTAALAAGATAREAASFANAAAGIVVSKMGTAVPTPAEILSA
jgi:D-beta-D-heptose 7-phosphate kinase/D-beta-D-heptose 1-phosphate adenosyltransferase